jgi:hypothetical protein
MIPQRGNLIVDEAMTNLLPQGMAKASLDELGAFRSVPRVYLGLEHSRQGIMQFSVLRRPTSRGCTIYPS